MFSVQARVYRNQDKQLWDQFVAESKNGVFLFVRDYLEYHSDRFKDLSLLFYQGERLVGVLPANASQDRLVSHGGLTFGGVVSGSRMRTPLMIEIFRVLIEHCRERGIKTILYKAVPHIYHLVPAEEDLYALFLMKARLVRRDVSSTLLMAEKPDFSKGRLWSVKKSKQQNLQIREGGDLNAFVEILGDVLLKKHHVRPTHSLDELKYLAGRFLDSIKLFTIHRNGSMLGGTIIYESRRVAHVQYMAATDEGKKVGALDNLFEYLINQRYAGKPYFDFGISTEQEGRYLNIGLITHKEEFGARAVAYDTYEIIVE